MNNYNLIDKNDLDPNMDFYIRFIKEINFGANSTYNISERFLLYDSQSSQWLEKNTILEKNKYFHINKKDSDFNLDSYYLCKNPNNSKCILEVDDYTNSNYKAIIKYGGFKLAQKVDSFSIMTKEEKLFEVSCPFYFNNPIINFSICKLFIIERIGELLKLLKIRMKNI